MPLLVLYYIGLADVAKGFVGMNDIRKEQSMVLRR